ncbi:MAG TPA: sigma-70 family RNA polymerase sigma factor [Acidobacteriota bacterium]|nr:sigma-70 family RNA polymerase sigma factor [Acidobacteriota bacterium]
MTCVDPAPFELEGLRRGDPDALARLIERYQERLFRYLLNLTGHRQTAEDLFQETWVRVLEKGHLYKDKWKFDAWLFSVARHLVIDQVRRKKAVSLDELVESQPAKPEIGAGDDLSPLELCSRTEQSERIWAALQQLPVPCREVILLRFHEDMQLDEIAQVVHAPLSTVKSRLYRGLETLRGLFEGEQA